MLKLLQHPIDAQSIVIESDALCEHRADDSHVVIIEALKRQFAAITKLAPFGKAWSFLCTWVRVLVYLHARTHARCKMEAPQDPGEHVHASHAMGEARRTGW